MNFWRVLLLRRKSAIEICASVVVLALLFAVLVGRADRVLTSRDLPRPPVSDAPLLNLSGLVAPVSFLVDTKVISGSFPAEADGVWMGGADVKVAFLAEDGGNDVAVLEVYAPPWQVSAPVVTALKPDGTFVGSVAVYPGQPAILLVPLNAVRSGAHADLASYQFTLKCSSDESEGSEQAPPLCLKLFGLKVEVRGAAT